MDGPTKLSSGHKAQILSSLERERSLRREKIAAAYQSDQPRNGPSQAPNRYSSFRRRSRDELIREKEEKHQQDCSFQPLVHGLPQGRNLNYLLSGPKLPQQEKTQQLAQPKNGTFEKREKLRKVLEDKEMELCTFRPNSSRGRTASRSASVTERLYKDAEIKHRREKSQRELQEHKLSFSFHPKISAGSVHSDRSPLYKRINEVQLARNSFKQRLRKSFEDRDVNMTFRPQINRKSE